jgi:Zn-dependent protease
MSPAISIRAPARTSGQAGIESTVFGSFHLRPTDQIIAILVSFIIATAIHEFCHAFVAWKLGDDTARNLGRITLNPVEHFEPIGFIGMVLISLGFPVIGWGKPVPVNPSKLRRYFGRRPQTGMAIVALAGPVSNVIQAGLAVIPIQVAARTGHPLPHQLDFALSWFIFVNILLASFNMIPVPPLDGHKILTGILPAFWYPVLAPLERYGFMILILFLFIGGRAGTSILGGMIDPVQNALVHLLYHGLL